MTDLTPIRERARQYKAAEAYPLRGYSMFPPLVNAALIIAPDVSVLLAEIDRLKCDLGTLAPIGRRYLDALDADPEHEYLTVPEAILVTEVREAVERWESR